MSLPAFAHGNAMLYAGYEPLAGHRLTTHLGSGGFGDVWEASAPNGGRVAMKFLNCRNQSGNMVANELKHLLALRDLKHPNLIRLKSVFATSHHVVLAMELADGSLLDLQDLYWERRQSLIPVDHGLDLLEQAAQGLDFLAQTRVRTFGFTPTGLQHCDVKPSNLLLIGDQLKVADFGLCGSEQLNSRRRGFRGTPPYAAPEMYEGRVTDRCDQYALAVTFCELCIGERAFRPPTPKPDRQYYAVVDFDRLREKERMVLARALDRVAINRWPSCTVFVQKLRTAIAAGRTPKRLQCVGKFRGPAADSDLFPVAAPISPAAKA